MEIYLKTHKKHVWKVKFVENSLNDNKKEEEINENVNKKKKKTV